MNPGFVSRVADFWGVSGQTSGQRASAAVELIRASARVAVKFGFTREEVARVVVDSEVYDQEPYQVGRAIVTAVAAGNLLGVDPGEDAEAALQRMWDRGV